MISSCDRSIREEAIFYGKEITMNNLVEKVVQLVVQSIKV